MEHNYPKQRKSSSDLSKYRNKEWLYNEYIIKDRRFTNLDNLITLCKNGNFYKVHYVKKDNQQPSLNIKEGSTTIESTSKKEGK